MFDQNSGIDPPRLPIEAIGNVFWQSAGKDLCADHRPIIELMFNYCNWLKPFKNTTFLLALKDGSLRRVLMPVNALDPAGMIALADEIDSTLAAGIKQQQQVLAGLARLARAAPKEGTFVPVGF